jgi:ribitol-5-phosphate 2-dehydrogenase (NADP+) / D-ribitol-5-phosphate cytidylyltransferase
MTDFPRRRTVAVVLAGGTGSRVGHDIPKQLLKVAGRTVLEHTLAALHSSPHIDEILIMMNEAYIEQAERLVRQGELAKVTRILAGGSTRNETSRLALQALGDQDCNVLFHDAVRPFVDHRIIRDCVDTLRTHDAVDVAIPSADTIISTAGDRIVDIPDRSTLRRGQTPQAFRLGCIREAYERAELAGFSEATDDCSIVLRFMPDTEIAVVAGTEQNIKITHPIDVFLADRLFQLASHQAPDVITEINPRPLAGKVLVIFGGSAGIGRSLATVAAEMGAHVAALSRSSTGTHVEDFAQVSQALQAVVDEHGRIDAVVVSAGVLEPADLGDLNADRMRHQLEINLLGPIHVAHACLPHLKESKGSLTFFTSSSYTRGRAGYSIYSAAKAGVVNLTQALADEWHPYGIRVNCINPERTDTPMRRAAFGREEPATLLDPRQVALSTASVIASDCNGQVIDVRRERLGLPRTSAVSSNSEHVIDLIDGTAGVRRGRPALAEPVG